jgi:uncharacterized protein (TIGR00369 family)
MLAGAFGVAQPAWNLSDPTRAASDDSCKNRGVSEFDEVVSKLFSSMSPHMRDLSFEILSLDRGVCVSKLPYREELIGDPVSGVLHGGVVTSLLDSAGGAAVLSALQKPTTLATLDLRIDYVRPSPPGTPLLARVECYKLTRHVAFTRGVAYDASESDPIASMSATYMLHTQSSRSDGDGSSE